MGAGIQYCVPVFPSLYSPSLVEPDLHRVLEQELPFFDPPQDDSPSSQSVFSRVRRLLEERREQITPTNRDLATWVVIQIIKSLVHAAVLEPPKQFVLADIEQAITNAVMGYLIGTEGGAAAR